MGYWTTFDYQSKNTRLVCVRTSAPLALSCGFAHDADETFSVELATSLIRHALGPGGSRLEIDVCSIRPWTMNALVADKYFCSVPAQGGGVLAREDSRSDGKARSGGLFLVGDAAHQFPPAGGFGLNTGVQVRRVAALFFCLVSFCLPSSSSIFVQLFVEPVAGLPWLPIPGISLPS